MEAAILHGGLLADALEEAGCRVRITGVDYTEPMGGSSGRNNRYCATYALKEYSERLDVDSVIFTLAHPAFYRRICFGVRVATYGACNGSTVQAPDSLMEEDGLAHNIMFSHLEPIHNGRTPEQFLAEMLKSLPDAIKEWMED